MNVMKKMKFSLRILIIISSLLVVFGSYNVVKAETNDVHINYQSHVQNIGWQGQVNDGETSGTEGRSLRLEAVKINLSGNVSGMSITYQAHVQNVGWMDWVTNSQMAGTQGRSLRLEAIKIKLNNAPAGYHVQYQVHVQNIGWMDWVQDGQVAGTVGKSLRAEAIRVKIVKDQQAAQLQSKAKTIAVAIDIGHNVAYDSGATGIRQEDTITMDVGQRVINKLKEEGYNVISTKPDTASSVEDSLQQRVDAANNGDAELFVSIHANAGGGKGTEVWAGGSAKSIELAHNIENNMIALGYNNRGVKVQGVDGQHLYVLNNTVMPAVLVETCFVDSNGDMDKYNPENIANAIVKGIISSSN
ncbi:N-acetylmuramoyl-L-alanine amidase [Clostridium arbusti]|uniref:N-acetylmuramoyl-L-alanine amidase n=1 Tax=Clostridium arbusti TaxID=1137848 RepID=UPI00028A0FF7|nr:N-acetylmuramoyl-L-alanine amidase [Clostridium arbusti]